MTPAEQAAQRQAHDFVRAFNPMQFERGPLQLQRGAPILTSRTTAGMCLRDGRDVTYEFLDGDFELDDPLALAYLRSIMPSTPAPAPAAAPAVSTPDWLQDWKEATASGAPVGSLERTWGEFLGGTIGPGNILASFAGAVEGGALTAKQVVTKAQMERAVAQITEQGAKGVQINRNVRIYDANALARSKMRARGQTPGKHLMKPKLRIKLTSVSSKIIQVGGMSARAATGGISGGVGYSATMASRAASISADKWLAGNALRFLKTPGVPLMLAVVPSLMIDAADSYEYNASGQGNMNWRNLGVLSAKSQSANLVGFGLGAITPAALGLIGMGAAVIGTGGVVLIALGVGVAAQVTFNALGWGDNAADAAKNVLSK
jgi:hypothetical protein